MLLLKKASEKLSIFLVLRVQGPLHFPLGILVAKKGFES